MMTWTLASTGHLIEDLLERLNKLAYYKEKPPKSLGYEWFEKEVMPFIDLEKYREADLLHTFVHHNAFQIAHSMYLFDDLNKKRKC